MRIKYFFYRLISGLRILPGWKFLCQLTLFFLRNKPMPSWPVSMSYLFGIYLPQAVIPYPSRTAEARTNINIIKKLFEKTIKLEGDIAECGVFRGNSIVPMGLYVKEMNLTKKVYGFDSFEGFDDSITIDLELGGQDNAQKEIGGFNATSLGGVVHKIKLFSLESHIKLIPGYFQNTLSHLNENTFSFVHLDCDIYTSYKVCLEFFYPRLTRGGIILFDEYNDPPWPGYNKAIDEFFLNKEETPIEIESENYLKYYICKK